MATQAVHSPSPRSTRRRCPSWPPAGGRPALANDLGDAPLLSERLRTAVGAPGELSFPLSNWRVRTAAASPARTPEGDSGMGTELSGGGRVARTSSKRRLQRALENRVYSMFVPAAKTCLC